MYLKPPHLPKATILVLEEDPFLRAGLCSLLSAAGYLLAAGDANPAGRADLVLRGLGPDQAPQEMRHLLDHSVPVILLVDRAAWTGLDFFDAANALCAAAVLQRPFSRSALLSLVAEVLSQPVRDAAEADRAALPGPADLLIWLENPNFA